jgi:hypothetical protein
MNFPLTLFRFFGVFNFYIFPISGYSSRQHSRPEGRPLVRHQRERDDQGLPQAKDQGRKGLRHQGPNKGNTFFYQKMFHNKFLCLF